MLPRFTPTPIEAICTKSSYYFYTHVLPVHTKPEAQLTLYSRQKWKTEEEKKSKQNQKLHLGIYRLKKNQE